MEWKEVRLGDVCEIKGGKRLPKGVNLITQKNSHPYIRVRDLGKCKTIEINSSYEYVDEITQKQIKKYITQKGDILISIVGTIGLIAIVGDSLNGANLTENCVKLVKLDKIDSEYLYYYLKSPFGQQNISRGTVGAVQAKLPIKNIQEFSIICPELISDQRRIASILSSLDRKIELNNKINADLEEMAQAIFKNWFVDFEPFKDGKFVDSELGMIPEGWKVGSPYEYVKVVYGAPYKSAKFNDNGEGLPLIRIRDLKDCNPQFYTPEILPQTEYVNMGDIVAGMDAEFVPHIWKGNTGLLNQRVCKLMPQQTSISNLFVLYLMKPELEFVQSYKTGTTVSHLGKADIDKFVVVLPPLKVVEECSKILDSILQRIKNISAESRTLSTLRDTLLPRLMSGELEVPE
jgi:type I restriction enzyme S subunit